MTNPFLKRMAAQGKTEHGRTSEVRLSKGLAARLQPGSGSQVGAKGDMRLKRLKSSYRIEAKSTKNLTMNLELAWLTKIAHEAAGAGEIPALTVSFVTPEGKPQTPRNAEWVMMPRWAFEELIED